ncbi:hypothetical protein niasHT_006767 [Heterodera trifolii]|uniref:Uncharacterized protein n=1 Tax=Heterodera trifolii TaxID=157864 RepID=A0ABD2LX14_9BILA
MSGRSGRSGKRRQDGPGRPSRPRQQQHTQRDVQSAYQGPREPPEQPTVRGWDDTRDFCSALKIFVNEVGVGGGTTRRNVKEEEAATWTATATGTSSAPSRAACDSTTDDYIHANWITALGEQRFICTQGPLEDDLRRLLDNGLQGEHRKHCDALRHRRTKQDQSANQYWPTPDKKGGNCTSPTRTITVHFIEETALEPDLYRTKLAVLSRNGSMYVHHFHWRRWPDRGVPQNELAPLRLLFQVQQFRRSVVHCSAGENRIRTGTLVALHIAYDTLQRGHRLNILALARNLRQHRAQSVQTLDQYLYIYYVILRYAQNKAADTLNIDERALTTFLREMDERMTRS